MIVLGEKLCGLRPTGRLHLGHYFSVIKPALQGAEVLIANYHAPHEKNTKLIIEVLQKFNATKIRIQKEVFNPELYFDLLDLANIGDLERMTQYKSTKLKTAQLLTYPVLMAHDILGYKEVLVGEDQTQHLQYARKILNKYNKKIGLDYVIPEGINVGGRIKDLKHPDRKMSKSYPEGCLFLDDSREVIQKKIRKANMDKDGYLNLATLYKDLVDEIIPSSNLELKERLTDKLCQILQINH